MNLELMQLMPLSQCMVSYVYHLGVRIATFAVTALLVCSCSGSKHPDTTGELHLHCE